MVHLLAFQSNGRLDGQFMQETIIKGAFVTSSVMEKQAALKLKTIATTMAIIMTEMIKMATTTTMETIRMATMEITRMVGITTMEVTKTVETTEMTTQILSLFQTLKKNSKPFGI